MRNIFLLLLALQLCPALDFTNTAEARRGIPIVWGNGPTVKEVGKLPPDAARDAREAVGQSVSVGYLYNHFHIFYLDFWTWEGQYVLFAGDDFWELQPADWQDLIGGPPEDKYGVPVLYRVPLGLLIIVVIVAGFVIKKVGFPSEQEVMQKHLNDKRYKAALDSIFDADNDDAKIVTSVDEHRFTQATDMLVDRGVKPDAAQTNLRKLVNLFLADNNARVDHAIDAAGKLRQNGDLESSRDVYKSLVESLPADDARYEKAESELATVEQELADKATQAPSESSEPTS